MLNITSDRRSNHHHQEGYILVWVMFLVAAFTIWLSVAVPRTVQDIQRDRELETMERGRQYVRAVQLYYKRFHAFPPNKDALVNTNEIRFLRKKYIDPTTGKDDWKPILWGQAKTQTLGFFGQPLTGGSGGMMAGGIGPSGNGGMNGGMNGGSSPTSVTLGSSGFGSSGFGSSNSGSSFGGSSFGSSMGGGSSMFGSSNSGTASTGSATGSPAGTNGSSAPGSNGTDSSSNAQTFGGAGIIGFSPASPKQSIFSYKKKNHYNEWEFIYDPMLDMRTMSGNTGMIGQPAGTPTNGSPGFTSGSPSTPSSSQPSTPAPAAPTSPQ